MRSLAVIVLAALTLVAAPDVADATEEATVPELVEMSAELAGRRVSVRGELVGDYGFRSDGWMWTQLNGDAYVDEPIAEGGTPLGANIGIGIRIPEELAGNLGEPGGYHFRGPVVRAVGMWQHHDPDRQGESYLQVETLTVVEPGRRLDEGPDTAAIALGILLLAVSGGIYLTIREES